MKTLKQELIDFLNWYHRDNDAEEWVKLKLFEESINDYLKSINPDVGSSVSFAEWKRAMRKEQLYYPSLKFQKIREDYLEYYWREGYTPTDACNDILTAV